MRELTKCKDCEYGERSRDDIACVFCYRGEMFQAKEVPAIDWQSRAETAEMKLKNVHDILARAASEPDDIGAVIQALTVIEKSEK